MHFVEACASSNPIHVVAALIFEPTISYSTGFQGWQARNTWMQLED